MIDKPGSQESWAPLQSVFLGIVSAKLERLLMTKFLLCGILPTSLWSVQLSSAMILREGH